MPHTLLLADDSVTIQRVIELTFADEDITVVAVSDGDQAIARLDSAPPDIVLADIGMPGKTGYEVAQYMKQSPKLARIPVVLLTGAFEPVDQARANEAGCDGILAKPFEPQLVISRVKELLGKGAPVKPADKGNPAPPPAAPAPAPLPASSARKDDYFDRLDAAFTSAAAAPPPALVAASKLKPGTKSAHSADTREQLDVIHRPSPQPPVDLPLAPPPAAPPVAAAPPVSTTAATIIMRPDPATSAPTVLLPPKPEPAARMPDESATDVTRPVMMASQSAAPPLPAQPVQIPALADAFAALLAAEQAEPLPPSVPTWPASGPPTDVIADQVVRRVLDQMSDRVVRETVTAVVSEIAERLIKEEIERIKSTIK
ncbi:MAG TPA: response regulator [Vicinamibacterales bacterium]|nr:response regulator [Vicinamibacterales bacterium]